jgi:uncharacterized protein (DUF2336 family)
MIIDAFLDWSQRAPRERRIEAADALARSYLHSPLDEPDRRQVLTGLFALLDDPCVEVRERLASVFADRRDAPRALVLRLIDDVPSVSAALFARSPVLLTTHLIDALQRGEPRLEEAIAQRMSLDQATISWIVQKAGVAAGKALVANPYVQLSGEELSRFIDRFSGDLEALDALQANRRLSPEHQCLLVARCAEAYQSNAFVRALVPDKRLERLTGAARERALLAVLMRLDGKACWQAAGALHARGTITPAFVLRVALSGHIPTLEAMVARLCDVSMDRVRSAFVHPRPVVAATLLKKTGLNDEVRNVLSMALVMARELARAEVDWTPSFFAETLIEVVDQRSVEQVIDGVSANGPIDATVALCHSIAADIMQADARAYTVASRVPEVSDLEEMFAEASPEVQVDVAITDAIAA